MNRCVLIMAGGTGGHVFPALAVAEVLRQRGVAVHWIGARGGIEERIVPHAGIPLTLMRIGGLRGKGWTTWLLAPLRLVYALGQVLVAVMRIRPDVMLGMGGFVSGPGGLVAALLRRPLLIHEQNAVAGMTNRWLSHLATRVMVAFDGVLPGRRTICVGNPVRRELLRLEAPTQRLARHDGPLRILVLGGSRGAQAINEAMPTAIACLAVECSVRHQTGLGRATAVAEDYIRQGLSAQVDDFIADMAAAYDWADLVVCRAGALTVSEIMAVGLAAVFVPYPHAVDDHQRCNAEPLVEAGAACLVLQGPDFESRLQACLSDLMVIGDADSCRQRLSGMAQRAHAMARPDAASVVVDLCLEVADG